jgi:hypothetical protein
VFIICKQFEDVAQKELVNPRMHAVLVLQKWNKITKQLLKFTYTKGLKNKKNVQGQMEWFEFQL